MRREPGFYWIMEREDSLPEVAQWDGDAWYATGYDLDIPDPFRVWSERLIPPEDASSAARR